jgi:hypothetical protein
MVVVLLCAGLLTTAGACGVTPASRPPTTGTVPTTTSATPVLPTDLVGENGQVAFTELRAAGFRDPIFHSDNGKAVLLFSDWTVVAAQVEHGTAVIEVTKK